MRGYRELLGGVTMRLSSAIAWTAVLCGVGAPRAAGDEPIDSIRVEPTAIELNGHLAEWKLAGRYTCE
jgi:hypothetical protein